MYFVDRRDGRGDVANTGGAGQHLGQQQQAQGQQGAGQQGAAYAIPPPPNVNRNSQQQQQQQQQRQGQQGITSPNKQGQQQQQSGSTTPLPPRFRMSDQQQQRAPTNTTSNVAAASSSAQNQQQKPAVIPPPPKVEKKQQQQQHPSMMSVSALTEPSPERQHQGETGGGVWSQMKQSLGMSSSASKTLPAYNPNLPLDSQENVAAASAQLSQVQQQQQHSSSRTSSHVTHNNNAASSPVAKEQVEPTMLNHLETLRKLLQMTDEHPEALEYEQKRSLDDILNFSSVALPLGMSDKVEQEAQMHVQAMTEARTRAENFVRSTMVEIRKSREIFSQKVANKMPRGLIVFIPKTSAAFHHGGDNEEQKKQVEKQYFNDRTGLQHHQQQQHPNSASSRHHQVQVPSTRLSLQQQHQQQHQQQQNDHYHSPSRSLILQNDRLEQREYDHSLPHIEPGTFGRILSHDTNDGTSEVEILGVINRPYTGPTNDVLRFPTQQLLRVTDPTYLRVAETMIDVDNREKWEFKHQSETYSHRCAACGHELCGLRSSTVKDACCVKRNCSCAMCARKEPHRLLVFAGCCECLRQNPSLRN